MCPSEVTLAPAESKPPVKFRQHFAASAMITVSVGTEQVTYRAHKDILVDDSPFFTKMFDSGMAEAHTDHVQLPEDSPEAFEHFLSWIYFDEPPPPVDYGNLTCALECWVPGDKLGMAKWQDSIISKIMA